MTEGVRGKTGPNSQGCGYQRDVCVCVCVCDTDLEITGEKRYLDPGAQLCSCSGGPPGTPSMFRKVTRLLRRCL